MFRKIFVLLAVVLPSSSKELTSDNYDSETSGKTVFVKFFAPWCSFSKKLKPHWDKLTSDFASSSTQLIAHVDCTAGGKALCDQHGVRGYPTLKWGDPSDLQDYNGGRSYDSLKKFANENLKPICSVRNIHFCNSVRAKQIDDFQQMSVDDLRMAVLVEEQKIAAAEKIFEEKVANLEKAYGEASSDKEKSIMNVKSSGLELMKSALKSKVTEERDDEL